MKTVLATALLSVLFLSAGAFAGNVSHPYVKTTGSSIAYKTN